MGRRAARTPSSTLKVIYVLTLRALLAARNLLPPISLNFDHENISVTTLWDHLNCWRNRVWFEANTRDWGSVTDYYYLVIESSTATQWSSVLEEMNKVLTIPSVSLLDEITSHTSVTNKLWSPRTSCWYEASLYQCQPSLNASSNCKAFTGRVINCFNLKQLSSFHRNRHSEQTSFPANRKVCRGVSSSVWAPIPWSIEANWACCAMMWHYNKNKDRYLDKGSKFFFSTHGFYCPHKSILYSISQFVLLGFFCYYQEKTWPRTPPTRNFGFWSKLFEKYQLCFVVVHQRFRYGAIQED